MASAKSFFDREKEMGKSERRCLNSDGFIEYKIPESEKM
jgi:hypothetical protein